MSIDAHCTEDGTALSVDSGLSRTLIVGTSPLIDWSKLLERLQNYYNDAIPANHQQTNSTYFAIGIHPYFIRELVNIAARNRIKQAEKVRKSPDGKADSSNEITRIGDVSSSSNGGSTQQIKNGFEASPLINNNAVETKFNSTATGEQDQQEQILDHNENEQEEQLTQEDFNEALAIYMSELEAHLQANPTLRVGEIGLDKTRKRGLHLVPLPNQFEFFKAQFLLAGKYGRSVSIHCVRAHGTLLEFFRELEGRSRPNTTNNLPRGIYLHSWSGSAQVTRDLLRLKSIGPLIYFGFSFKINYGRLQPYVVESPDNELGSRMMVIPLNRILTESDAGLGDEKRKENVLVIAKQVEEILGVPLDTVERNFDEFINLAPA